MAKAVDLFNDDLEIDESELQEIKTGGDFVRKNTASFSSKYWYSMYVEDPDKSAPYDEIPKPDYSVTFDAGTRLYYATDRVSDAKLAKSKLGERVKISPRMCWRIEAPTSSILGWTSDKTPEEVFKGPVVGYDVSSGKFGMEWDGGLHLVTLPSIVQSYLMARGKLKEPVFDYGELSSLTSVTVPVQEHYIQNAQGEDGVLLAARKELWKLCGEEDFTLWDSKGTAAAVQAPLLKKALATYHYSELSDLWCTVGQVGYPHITTMSKAKDNKPSRPGLALAFYAIFPNEEAARAAVEAEGDGETSSIPAAWRTNAADGGEEEWKKYLKQFLTEAKAPKAAPLFDTWMAKPERAGEFQEKLGVSVADVAKWAQAVWFAK